jgi:acetyl esterase/lipase
MWFTRFLPAVRWLRFTWLVFGMLLFGGCQPTPTSNVLGYLLAKQMGTLPQPATGPVGSLVGEVWGEDGPLARASVVVAERTGRPHAAATGPDGRYRIDSIPVGQYVISAVAPGYAEQVDQSRLGIPNLITIRANEVTTARPLYLHRQRLEPLPPMLAQATGLTLTHTAIVTAPFPAGSEARMHAYRFEHAGVQIDTLRLYLPVKQRQTRLPLLFMVYPSPVDLWQSVSTAYTAQGFALVAISPVAARGTDILAHAADARVALELVRQGALSPQIDSSRTVALGGSFSSAILYQLLRMTGDEIAGWVTVGGVSDAFAGSAEFYAGRLEVPPQYEYLIPALGPPHLYPLNYLRYSPVYAAAELPPTMIIHTDADRVIPIQQAYALEAALRRAGVPLEVFYYEDVSHYLQIDENITAEGKAMFALTLDFAERILGVNQP